MENNFQVNYYFTLDICENHKFLPFESLKLQNLFQTKLYCLKTSFQIIISSLTIKQFELHYPKYNLTK